MHSTAVLMAVWCLAMGAAGYTKIHSTFKTAGTALGVYCVGNILYIADDANVITVDISDHSNPKELGSIAVGGARGITVEGTTAYVAAMQQGLVILDVSDPKNMRQLGEVSTPGQADALTKLGNEVFVADESNAAVRIDVTDPSNPVIKSMFSSAHGVDIALMQHPTNGLLGVVPGGTGYGTTIIGMKDPDKMVKELQMSGLNFFSVSVEGGFIYYASDTGMSIYDGADPTKAGPPKGRYSAGGQAFSVHVSGTTGYLAGSMGFQVLDVSDPSAVTAKDTLPLPNSGGSDLFVLPPYAFVCDGTDVQIIDIVEPTEVPPTEVPPTPAPPTEVPLTDAPPTEAPQTMAPPTAVPPTIAPPTAAPLTLAPPSPAPPTETPPTLSPPTSSPPTPSPPSPAPPTEAPPTMSPPTISPPTQSPPTPAPPTESPPTEAPLTQSPPTIAPATQAPPTEPPVTPAPPTLPPTTSAPLTPAPFTEAPLTSSPSTPAPLTHPPQTAAPNTPFPATSAPVTGVPTVAPSTPIPGTLAPSTLAPQTASPITSVPLTASPTTLAPQTKSPTTLVPQTKSPITLVPQTESPFTSTRAPLTGAPSTRPSETGVPSTLSPHTERPRTPAPVIPTPATAIPPSRPPTTPVPTTSTPQTTPPRTRAPETMAPAPIETPLSLHSAYLESPDMKWTPEERYPATPSPPIAGSNLRRATKKNVEDASLGAAITGGNGATLAVLGELECIIEDVDLSEAEPLDFEFHPLGIGIGDHKHKYFLGAVICNLCTVVVFIIINYGAAFAQVLILKVSWGTAIFFARCPGLMHIPILWLMTGTSLAGSNMAFFPGRAPGYVAVVGWLAIAYCIAVPALMWFLLLRPAKFLAITVPDPKIDKDAAELVAKYYDTRNEDKFEYRMTQTETLTGWKRQVYIFAFGKEVWVRQECAPDFYVEQYGLFFEQYRFPYQWFSILEIFQIITLSVLAAWKPSTHGTCTMRNLFLILVLFVYFTLTIILRPYNSALDQIIASMMSGSMSLAVVLMTISLASGGKTPALSDLAGVLLVMSAGLMLLKGLYDIGLYVLDLVIGRRRTALAAAHAGVNHDDWRQNVNDHDEQDRDYTYREMQDNMDNVLLEELPVSKPGSDSMAFADLDDSPDAEVDVSALLKLLNRDLALPEKLTPPSSPMVASSHELRSDFGLNSNRSFPSSPLPRARRAVI